MSVIVPIDYHNSTLDSDCEGKESATYAYAIFDACMKGIQTKNGLKNYWIWISEL